MPDTNNLDWTDPHTRRRLCTGVARLIEVYAPPGKSITELIEGAALTEMEIDALKAYFGPGWRS